MHQDSSPFDLTTDGAYQSPHLVEMFSRQIGSFIGIGILVLIGLAAPLSQHGMLQIPA